MAHNIHLYHYDGYMPRILFCITSVSELRTARGAITELRNQDFDVCVAYSEIFGSANLREVEISKDFNYTYRIHSVTILKKLLNSFDVLVILNNRLHLNVWLMELFIHKNKRIIYIAETFFLENNPSFNRIEDIKYILKNMSKAFQLIIFAAMNFKFRFIFDRLFRVFFKIKKNYSGIAPSQNYHKKCIGYDFEKSDIRNINTGLPGILLFENDEIRSGRPLNISNILFVSSPLHKDMLIPFSELLKVHQKYIRQLFTLFPHSSIRLRVHPLDNRENYSSLKLEFKNLFLETSETAVIDSMRIADLVIGFPSNLLLQSLVYGIPVIQILDDTIEMPPSFLDFFGNKQIPTVSNKDFLTLNYVQKIYREFPSLNKYLRKELSTSLDGLASQRISSVILND